MNFQLSKFFKGFGLIFLIIFLPLAIYKGLGIYSAVKESAKRGPPPSSVTTKVVKSGTWETIYKTAGTIKGEESATLRSESSGRVAKIYISEGATVEADTVLVELDSKVEEGEYLAISAQRDLSEKEYFRQKVLFAKNAVSQDEYDKARLTFESLKASAEAARNRLNRRKIISPYKGKVGVIRANIGDYVTEGTELVAIENSDKLYAVFSLGQSALIKLNESGNTHAKVIIFPVGSEESFKTIISSIDPLINDHTKTAIAKAYLPPEAGKKLLSGMSTGVGVVLESRDGIISIPTTSIAFAPFGDSVYLVDKSSETDSQSIGAKAKQQFVKILESRGDLTAIQSGIKEGEEVITSGTFKLFPGAPLIINNEVAPGAELNPNPSNT